MGANLVIRVAHSSGRWDASTEALERNVRRLRRHHSIVTRTELTRPGVKSALSWPEDGWGLWHPKGAADDCSIEWDRDVWDCEDRAVLPLTHIRIHTESGFLKPPCTAVLATLRHLVTRLRVEVSVWHLDLENTPLRREAARQERAALRAHWHNRRLHDPSVELIGQGDLNLDQRHRSQRDLVRRQMLDGTGMVNLWESHPLPAGGTHGPHLLDATLATIPGRSQLIRDDNSSDHRPYESELETRVPVPA